MIKKILLTILVLILAIVGYYVYMFTRAGKGRDSGPKQAPLAIKQHSDAFNKSIDTTMNAYFEMKAAFVEGDTGKAKDACKKMLVLINNIKLVELKKDTVGIFATDSLNIENVKASAKSLLIQPNITEMRKDFKDVSADFYPFLKAINYKGPKIYWQNCPMAFGEGKDGSWISNTEEIINPYLGKNHPEFKSSMLHCGEIKDTIQAQ